MPQHHEITLTEQPGCPGIFEVRCLCDWVTWSPRGEEHAGNLGISHLKFIAARIGK